MFLQTFLLWTFRLFCRQVVPVVKKITSVVVLEKGKCTCCTT